MTSVGILQPEHDYAIQNVLTEKNYFFSIPYLSIMLQLLLGISLDSCLPYIMLKNPRLKLNTFKFVTALCVTAYSAITE